MIRSLVRPKTHVVRAMAPVSLVDVTASSLFSGASAGSKRGNKNALLYWRQNGMLRSVTDHIAWDVASLPIRAYRVAKGPSARKHDLRRALALDPEAKSALMESRDIEEVTHAVLDLLNRPNIPAGRLAPLTRLTFFTALQATLTLCSEAFIRVRYIGSGSSNQGRTRGEPVELEPVNPTWVTAEGVGNAARWFIDDPDLGRLGPFDATELLYVRWPDPSNAYGRVVGMAATLANEIDAAEASAIYQSALFRNHGMPKVMVGIEGGDKPIDDAAIKKLNEEWMSKYGGVARAGGVHFFSRKIGATVVGYSPADLEVSTQQDAANRRVREGLAYPPEWLGILDNSNRSTIKESDLIRAKSVIAPQVALHEDWINNQLYPLFADSRADIFFCFESPIPEDHTRADEAAKTATWALEVNEWRERAGLDPDPKLDGIRMIPASVMPYTTDGIGIQASGSEYDPVDPNEAVDPADPNAEEDPEPDEEEEDEEEDDKPEKGGPAEAEIIAKSNDARVVAVARAIETVGFRRRLTPTMRTELRRWLSQIAADLDAEIPAALLDQLTRAYVADFAGSRVVDLEAGLQQRLRRSLAQGLARGESREALEKRIGKILGAARARTVVRTEVHRARQWSIWQLYAKSGIVAERQWIIRPDATKAGTRDPHRAMANQIRKVDEPFTAPDGSTTMYPGGFGVPGLDINCVCEQRVVTTARTLSARESWRMAKALAGAFERRFGQTLEALYTEAADAGIEALRARWEDA